VEFTAGGVKRALLFLGVAIMYERSALVIDHLRENVFNVFLSYGISHNTVTT
jgi:hypothetical protein